MTLRFLLAPGFLAPARLSAKASVRFGGRASANEKRGLVATFALYAVNGTVSEYRASSAARQTGGRGPAEPSGAWRRGRGSPGVAASGALDRPPDARFGRADAPLLDGRRARGLGPVRDQAAPLRRLRAASGPERYRAALAGSERSRAGRLQAQLLHVQRPLSHRRRVALAVRARSSSRAASSSASSLVADVGRRRRARASAATASGSRGALHADPVLVLPRLGVRQLRDGDRDRRVGARLRGARGHPPVGRRDGRRGGARARAVRSRTCWRC